MIEFAIITAPREVPTIHETIDSFRKTGCDSTLYIFAEPGSQEPDDSNYLWQENQRKLGAFNNFDKALRSLVAMTDKPYVCVILDDTIFRPDFIQRIQNFNDQRFVKLEAFTLITIEQDIPHEWRNDLGFIPHMTGWNSWGGPFVIRTDIARQIINHSFYLNHFRNGPNQQIDGCICETLKIMGHPVYAHNPSLADHIGETSTLGHGELTPSRKGYNYELWGN